MGISTIGGLPIASVSDQWGARSVAVDANNVYWSNGGAVTTNGIVPGSISKMGK